MGLGVGSGVEMGVGVGAGVGAGAGVGLTGLGVGNPGVRMVTGVVNSDGGKTGSMVTRLPRIKPTASPPAVPSRLPSISRPELSSRPDGDVPSIVTSTALLRANGFLRVRVTVSVAGSNTAERSFIALELATIDEPLRFAALTR